jgi:putative transposase
VALELGINHKRAKRVMKKFGIKPPRRKVNYFCTRSTNHHTYSNLIKNIDITKQHQLWCADVSFIKFGGKFWYLATIEDIYTRRVISAQIGKHHNHQLILTTVKQAIKNTTTVPMIFHSDQGTEFMAKAVTDYLESYGVKISVSDKASPWQNGYKESFFGRFKEEFGDFNRFDTVSELIEEIYSQVRYYNQERIHTALKMPPAVYANLLSDSSLLKRGT